MSPPLVVIVGPTASGKTELSLAVAEALDAEILSADSVQVYRGLDIGSGKASAAQLARVPHHGLDLADPDQPVDVERWRRHAEQVIAAVQARGRRLVVVGGTGLYVRALLRGLLPTPPGDPALRRQLEEEGRLHGPEALHRRLALVDPTLAARLGPRDLPRIVRGLEVHATTGVPLSHHQQQHGFAEQRHPARWLGLRWDREVLRRRIAERCQAMLAAGFLDELRALRNRGFGPQLRPLQSLGYKELGQVLDGELTLPQALELQIRNTQAYARRQMTWFRAEPEIHWLDPPHSPATALAHLRAPVAPAPEESR